MKRPCKICRNIIPSSVVINDKRVNISNRKFCLKCSPFGGRNTSQFPTMDKAIRKLKQQKTRSTAVLKARQRQKRQLFEYKGSSCEICGYDKPIMQAYAFHHLDPNQKEIKIASIYRKLETMKKEVDKCQLLCVRCHAEVHHNLFAQKLSGEQEAVNFLEVGSIPT